MHVEQLQRRETDQSDGACISIQGTNSTEKQPFSVKALTEDRRISVGALTEIRDPKQLIRKMKTESDSEYISQMETPALIEAGGKNIQIETGLMVEAN